MDQQQVADMMMGEDAEDDDDDDQDDQDDDLGMQQQQHVQQMSSVVGVARPGSRTSKGGRSQMQMQMSPGLEKM